MLAQQLQAAARRRPARCCATHLTPPCSNVELPDSIGVLAAHDFSRLRAEKLGLHMPGTRGWGVAEAQAWLHDAAADKLFWLMGGAGTGKTVVSALLLDRLGVSRIPAHHFCLHTDPDASQPRKILLSMSAQL